MFYMVIEHFKPDSVARIHARFKEDGRMLPPGVTFLASWVEPSGARCYQVMEAPSSGLLETWMARWTDLIDFEVVPVLASADFWERQSQQRKTP